MKPILISEGIYRSYCTEKEVEEGVRICVGQELRLNLLFTIAAVAANVRIPLFSAKFGADVGNRLMLLLLGRCLIITVLELRRYLDLFSLRSELCYLVLDQTVPPLAT